MPMFSIEGVKGTLKNFETLQDKKAFLSRIKSQLLEMIIKGGIDEPFPVKDISTGKWFDAASFRSFSRQEIDQVENIIKWVESEYLLLENTQAAGETAQSSVNPHTPLANSGKAEKNQEFGPGYIPNRKYTDEQFEYFEHKWDELRSQQQAYDACVAIFKLDPNKLESFIRQYRRWRNSRNINNLPRT